ncbi:signal peptide peptidase SppA [Opitutus sp. GAS368]|uniref:signal peptide peptidase SppA n=1 Tax=Opitutus sp. GAS368 TaxID=1882749 RepID=UPI00087AC70B|nr:signal peptide peptidase SppA [Opitutus sp. GAS368]SDS52155.1 protease-4 [Opitutus sp. GAS368]
MKNFFTSFFATLSAMVVFLIGGLLCFFLLIGFLAALGEKKPVAVQNGSYLVFDLAANIQDAPSQVEGLDQFMEAFGSRAPRHLQLREVTRALQAAAKDDAIKGLYLTGSFRSEGYGSGFAALKEVREAIESFKAAGKPVKAHLDFAGTREYYVASVADDLVLDPYGAIEMPGLASQPMFFTGAFEKFGIGVQVTRVGKYKSAVEPYLLKQMSPENREQIQKLLDDVWGTLTASIETARKLPAGALQKAVDEKGLIRADDAKKLKLVDRTAYLDEMLDELKAATGRKGSSQPFKQIAIKDYARLVSTGGVAAKRSGEGRIELGAGGNGKIAIVYAEGEIVDGTGNDDGYLYGEKTARMLRQIRQDDSISAVVLRVNSPGGSVTASEAILRELRLIHKDKPVIVSMGTVAASGGYWISTASDRVFAEPATITGSIGVFGMFVNFQGLATDKLGLTFDTVKTGRFADAATVIRPKTEAELAIFQSSVDWVYDQFIGKVSDARKLDRKVVEEIAQGRVWSGREALKLKLVDEIGGLADAVKYTATKAGLGENFRVTEYPHKKQFAEQFTEALEGRRHEESFSGPVGQFVREMTAEVKSLSRLNDPRGLYARLPFELRLN